MEGIENGLKDVQKGSIHCVGRPIGSAYLNPVPARNRSSLFAAWDDSSIRWVQYTVAVSCKESHRLQSVFYPSVVRMLWHIEANTLRVLHDDSI